MALPVPIRNEVPRFGGGLYALCESSFGGCIDRVYIHPVVLSYRNKPKPEGKTISIHLKGKDYTIKGELPNGVFYLEGPRGGDVHFAKPAGGVYMFFRATGGAAIYDKGLIVTATREQLAA